MQTLMLGPANQPAVLGGRETSWQAIIAAWLVGRQNPSTRRSYAYAVRDFFGRCGKTPDLITVADLIAYREAITRRDASGKVLNGGTVGARLAALSALFRFLARPQDARGTALIGANPVSAVERPRVGMFEHPRKMARADLLAILRACRGSDLRSLRDRALILGYALTGRRRAELAALTFGDLEEADGGRIFYRYCGKRGKRGFRELPPPVVEALRVYLAAAQRPMRAEDPVFSSVSGRLAGRALTGAGVAYVLKSRARAAGVDPRRVKVHGLRHLASELRRSAGARVEDLQAFLDHSSLSTTAIYLRMVVEGTADPSWQGAWAQLQEAEQETAQTGGAEGK